MPSDFALRMMVSGGVGEEGAVRIPAASGGGEVSAVVQFSLDRERRSMGCKLKRGFFAPLAEACFRNKNSILL